MSKTLSDTEFEIMCHFWETEDEKGFSELMNYFQNEQGKIWKKQTLNTFLTRLIQKNLLQFRKVGNKKFYSVNMTKKEYEKFCAQEILNGNYDGKLTKFLAALMGEAKIAELDEETLIADILQKQDIFLRERKGQKVLLYGRGDCHKVALFLMMKQLGKSIFIPYEEIRQEFVRAVKASKYTEIANIIEKYQNRKNFLLPRDMIKKKGQKEV